MTQSCNIQVPNIYFGDFDIDRTFQNKGSIIFFKIKSSPQTEKTGPYLKISDELS